ncbi:dihydropteroate synthase [Arcicella sp. LKC2W]|uniref:dihydropteroate synthase n=1 Tax=Arcicella sp. LKC2W TaxID=2984198 RepID=UPI002B1F49FA|nr:dihydropteroate synthase [Arcicella sp. LKC2W]MEA5460270.1 dihydropteroate synthase [Arcicella sp. LKC2W]
MLINLKQNLLDLSQPRIMGILNITPDSFYKGNRFTDLSKVLDRAEKMLSEGATFLDIGGHSTRPGASPVSEEEELNRVLPVVEAIIQKFPEALISIDTFRSSVAKKCVEAGAVIINDVSGGILDDKMFETVASLGVPYVLMHMRGTIETMTQMTNYDDLVTDVLDDLQKKVYQLRQLGQKDIIIDLGFGFAKTADQNYVLLKHLEDFRLLDCPMLVGVSRKSMIWRKLDISPNDSLNGSTVLNTVALMKGANILRVHDVKEAMETIKLISFLG